MDPREITTFIPRLLIRLYQLVRAGQAARCRFAPSCSEYAMESFKTKGLLKGSALTALRLLKCHPWHPGGSDPVPN